MGIAGSDTDLVVCEKSAMSGGAALFGASEPVAFMPDIRSIVEISILTGAEVPLPGTINPEAAT